MAYSAYFSQKRPSSTETFGLDLVNLLGDLEVITNVTCAITLKSGTTDINMGTMASGAALWLGTKVWQLIGGGIDGNYYFVTFTVTTSNQVLELVCVLPVTTSIT